MNKHTPAPWLIAEDRTKNFVYALNSNGSNIFSFSISAGYTKQTCLESIHTSIEEIEANAILAHSAPEMLEALEKLVRLPGDYDLLMDAEFVFSEARAVIKKAKGETP